MTGSGDEFLERLRELREQYKEAHRNGMDALKRRDLDALDKVIREERRILDEQGTIIDSLRSLYSLPKISRDRTGS